MGLLLLLVKPARNEGLGTLFKNASSKSTLWIYPVYLLLFVGVGFVDGLSIGFASFIFASILIFLLMRKKINEWFGGMTGDILGASVELTEVLLWMTLWLLHYFAMG